MVVEDIDVLICSVNVIAVTDYNALHLEIALCFFATSYEKYFFLAGKILHVKSLWIPFKIYSEGENC